MEFTIKIFFAIGMNLLENFYGSFHTVVFFTFFYKFILYLMPVVAKGLLV